jgi:dTDP-4-dehydrorhamnose reductase
MRILITGANGQLGNEACLAFSARGDEVIGVARDALDVAAPDTVAQAVAAHQANWIINCAAYTQVDKAEAEPEQAFAVNRDGARALAEAASASGSRLLHVSTDFVFGGNRCVPYGDEDVGTPLGVYGRSKWEGEQAVRALMPQAVILRTAWVYGVHGKNFVKTILRLMAERDELRVVDDQVGTPTWTADIVRAMQALIDQDLAGTWNFTSEGVASWFDFAHAIVATAAQLGHARRVKRVLPIPSSEYPTAARRPHYSVLSKAKIRSVLGYDIPHWRDSLRSMLAELPR